jgi:hypothetical protein
MAFAKIHTIRPGWDIAPLAKGGWGIYYNGQRCKDPMGQTGLAERFKTPGDAALALRDCTFEPLEN